MVIVRLFFILLWLVMMLPVTSYSLEVEGVEVSGTSSVDFLSHYMWRGQQLSDKWVIQPVVEITYAGFGFNYWANYDLHTSQVSETDYTAFYNFAVDKFDFTGGGIYYAFDGLNDTFEFFLSVGYDTLLSPNITAYYDVDEGSGLWIAGTIDHSFELDKERGTALNLGALVSYNIHHDVVGLDEDNKPFSDFNNAELSASLSYPLWKAITLEAKSAYTFAISGDARDAFRAFSIDPGDETDRKLYGGLSISIAF